MDLARLILYLYYTQYIMIGFSFLCSLYHQDSYPLLPLCKVFVIQQMRFLLAVVEWKEIQVEN